MRKVFIAAAVVLVLAIVGAYLLRGQLGGWIYDRASRFHSS